MEGKTDTTSLIDTYCSQEQRILLFGTKDLLFCSPRELGEDYKKIKSVLKVDEK